MKKTLIISSCFIMILCFSQNIIAQTDQGFPTENYKRNVVKWNITPFLLWSYKNINLSYERVISPSKSFSVNAGYFELPSTGIYDSLNIKASTKNSGFTVSGDYRFYFKNRNLKPSPDGLYWGPYASYHYYQFENNISVIDNADIQGDLQLSGNYNIISAGIQLGYQFIIKEKLSIDLVFMGPSLSTYAGKLTLDGHVSSEKYEDYIEAIRDILIARVPILNDLVQNGSINDNGVSTSFGFGFRYLMQIGYRF